MTRVYFIPLFIFREDSYFMEIMVLMVVHLHLYLGFAR